MGSVSDESGFRELLLLDTPWIADVFAVGKRFVEGVEDRSVGMDDAGRTVDRLVKFLPINRPINRIPMVKNGAAKKAVAFQ